MGATEMKINQKFQGHDARSLPSLQQRRNSIRWIRTFPVNVFCCKASFDHRKVTSRRVNLGTWYAVPIVRVHSDPFPEQRIPLEHVI